MSQQIVITYKALDDDGMTLHELHDRLGQMLEQGMPGDQVIRVRTKFGANKHGAVVKAITATSEEAR